MWGRFGSGHEAKGSRPVAISVPLRASTDCLFLQLMYTINSILPCTGCVYHSKRLILQCTMSFGTGRQTPIYKPAITTMISSEFTQLTISGSVNERKRWYIGQLRHTLKLKSPAARLLWHLAYSPDFITRASFNYDGRCKLEKITRQPERFTKF